VGKLTEDDNKLVDNVAKKYRKMGFIGCTGCKYCMPCPSGVTIPEIFSLVNEYYMKDRDAAVKAKYKEQTKDKGAKKCVSCGCCEDACPQHLPIRHLLKDAADTFEGNW
jgi:predicted aldo/keto reductase-like oxidoreductase